MTGVRSMTPCGAATAAKLQILRPMPLQLQHVAQPVQAVVAQPTSPTGTQVQVGPNSPVNAQRPVRPHTPQVQMQPCPHTPQQSHKQIMMTSQPVQVLPKQAPAASTPQLPKAGFRLAPAVSPGVAATGAKPAHAAGTSSVAFGGAKTGVSTAPVGTRTTPAWRLQTQSPMRQRVPVRQAQAVIFNPAVRSPSASYRSAAIPVGSNTVPPPRQAGPSRRLGDKGSAAIGQGQHSPRAAVRPPACTEADKDLGASSASGPQAKQSTPAAVLRLQQAKRMVLASAGSPQPPIPLGFLMPAMCVRVAGQSPLPRARQLQATLNPPQETTNLRSRRRSMSQQPQRPQDKPAFLEVEIDALAASVPGVFHLGSRPTSPVSMWRPPPNQQQPVTPPQPVRPLVQAPGVHAALLAQQAKSPTQWLTLAPASSKHQHLIDWLRPAQGGSSGSVSPSSPVLRARKHLELEPCKQVKAEHRPAARSEASLPRMIVQEPHPEPRPETAVPTTSTEAVSTSGSQAMPSGCTAAKFSIHTPAVGGGIPPEPSPPAERIDGSPEVDECGLSSRRPPELRPELQKLELVEPRSAPSSARSQEGVPASARSQQSLPSSAPPSGKSDQRPFRLLPEDVPSPQKNLMRQEQGRAKQQQQLERIEQLEQQLCQQKQPSPPQQHRHQSPERETKEEPRKEQQTMEELQKLPSQHDQQQEEEPEQEGREELEAEAWNEVSTQSEPPGAEPEEAWDGGFSWSMETMHPMVTEKERDYIQQCTEALGQDVLLAGGLDEYLHPDSSLRLQLLGLRGGQDGGSEDEADEEPSTPRRMVRRCLEAKLQRFARSGSETVFVQPGYLMTQGGKKIVKMKLVLNSEGSNNISVCWDWDVKLEHSPQ